MNQSDQRKRIIEKTRLKRDVYRVLGHGPEDLHEERNTNIYNDWDFYQVILGDFLQSNEEAAEGGQSDDEGGLDKETEKQLLGNAYLNIT